MVNELTTEQKKRKWQEFISALRSLGDRDVIGMQYDQMVGKLIEDYGGWEELLELRRKD